MVDKVVKEKPTAYGFWEYDQFPYCVGGELSRLVPGRPGYWRWCNTGMITKPFTVMTLADGRRIDAKLKELKAQHRFAQIELTRGFVEQAAKVLSDIPGVVRVLKEQETNPNG